MPSGFVPLGNCYEASAHLLIEELLDDALLVHGLVTHPDTGEKHGHAWCEVGSFVFDYSNNLRLVIPKSDYYRAGGISRNECTYYNKTQAIALLVEHMHYGPWS